MRLTWWRVWQRQHTLISSLTYANIADTGITRQQSERQTWRCLTLLGAFIWIWRKKKISSEIYTKSPSVLQKRTFLKAVFRLKLGRLNIFFSPPAVQHLSNMNNYRVYWGVWKRGHEIGYACHKLHIKSSWKQLLSKWDWNRVFINNTSLSLRRRRSVPETSPPSLSVLYLSVRRRDEKEEDLL